MVNKKHRVLCIVLCLMLALSALVVGTSAASAVAGDTVYVKLNNGWSQVYIYAWTEGVGNNAQWPGIKMTKVTDDVYSYTYSKDFDMVIFNNGSGGNGNQTADLTYTGNGGNGRIYNLATGTWSNYADAPTNPTTSTSPTTATQPSTGSSGDGVTVYLKNEAGWTTVKCYMWNSSNDSNANWPGENMTAIGDGVYMYTSSKAYKNCIFNGGSDSNKTADLTTMDGYIYNNKTNQWEVYDTSPLQIKSFGADPSTGVYTDTDVTLSTLAVNTKTGATVSYKFSVTNSAGVTSVLSNFSDINSLIWTPTTAGDYTITFDYKDTDGNTNQRTTTVSVIDDSNIVKPIIKGVTPADLNPVKVNSAATVSVKAGGGKIGTNLLFYKYVVVDPNGVKNTPYYTLSNTYKFTPTVVGTYKVSVYVQGSDNSTVNKTYSYNAIDGELPTTSPRPTVEQPTTVKPFVKGDANHNGMLDIDDVTYIQKSMADFTGYDVLVSECDMDDDGSITIMDCTIIQKILAGYAL
ncbi:MAG: starch-binding protein [Ruminococcus sp.]|nr:starch-binding protein [Ruminococcus sp.]